MAAEVTAEFVRGTEEARDWRNLTGGLPLIARGHLDGLRSDGVSSSVILVSRSTYALRGSSSSLQQVVLVKRIDLADADSATLIVRVHSASIPDGAQELDIVAQSIAPSGEEPQVAFSTTAGENVAQILKGDPTPGLIVTALALPLPAKVRLLLRATQSPVPDDMKCTLSVSLIRRARLHSLVGRTGVENSE